MSANNPLVILAVVIFGLALFRGIAVEGARRKNITAHLGASDEACNDAGSLALILLLIVLGAFGVLVFAFR